MSFNWRPPSPVAIGAKTKFPRRPGPGVLSVSIPLFFIGRNKNGLWVAREADGRIGGLFVFKRSALRFANYNCVPVGCATMFLTGHFELDIANQGNPLVGWLEKVMRAARRLIPILPAS